MANASVHVTQAYSSEDSIVLTVRLLGATAKHAELLANNTKEAILSGGIAADLEASGFPAGTGIDVVGIKILGSGVAPQYYPVIQKGADDMPNVTYEYDFEEVEVTVEERPQTAPPAGGEINATAIAAGVGGAAAAVIAIIACVMAARYSARRRYLTSEAQNHQNSGE